MRALCALGLAAGMAGCLSESPRPAPPVLSIVLDSKAVRSTTPNDTLRGTIRVEDPDGLDSIWLAADTARAAADGLFETVYQSRFRFAIRAGLPATTQIAVTLEARDVVGFRSQLDTFVTVIQ